MAEWSVGGRAAAQSQSALEERQLCSFFSIQHYISESKPKMIPRRLETCTYNTNTFCWTTGLIFYSPCHGDSTSLKCFTANPQDGATESLIKSLHKNHCSHQGLLPSTTVMTLSTYSMCTRVIDLPLIILSSVKPQLCLLAGLCWIGELVQCYHVHYVPVEPLSHSLFLLTENPLRPFSPVDVTSSDQAGQSVHRKPSL